MQLTLTIEQLTKAEACEEGIAAFRAAFQGESATVEWTRDKQIELLRSPLGKWMPWAHRNGLIPWWPMRGADLQGADLRGADLRGAILQGANLQGANLQDADLRGADLQGADLRGADLQGADLRGAILQGANLRGAILQGAFASTLYAELFRQFGWEIDDAGRLRRIAKQEPADVAAGISAAKT